MVPFIYSSPVLSSKSEEPSNIVQEEQGPKPEHYLFGSFHTGDNTEHLLKFSSNFQKKVKRLELPDYLFVTNI